MVLTKFIGVSYMNQPNEHIWVPFPDNEPPKDGYYRIMYLNDYGNELHEAVGCYRSELKNGQWTIISNIIQLSVTCVAWAFLDPIATAKDYVNVEAKSESIKQHIIHLINE